MICNRQNRVCNRNGSTFFTPSPTNTAILSSKISFGTSALHEPLEPESFVRSDCLYGYWLKAFSHHFRAFPGASPAQAAKCWALGKRLISMPISPDNNFRSPACDTWYGVY